MKTARALTILASIAVLLMLTSPAQANASELFSAETTVTGAPALIIILVVLALIIIGVVAVVRFVRRKAKGK